MDLTKIPIVPQWNITGGSVCTPDGGFLYIALKSINYIGPIRDGKRPPDIRVFQTRQAVKSIDVDGGWGNCKVITMPANHNIDGANAGDGARGGASAMAGAGGDVGELEVHQQSHQNEGRKLFAVLAADNAVQIWDFDRACVISGHKAHIGQSHVDGRMPNIDNRKVLLSYMCNHNVLSMDSQDLIVYCVASNSFYRRPTFISTRSQTLTIMRCSPFKENIFAVGSSRGLVLVCDLQMLQIVYTLRGHEAPISSLAWTRIEMPTIEQKMLSAQKVISQQGPELDEMPRGLHSKAHECKDGGVRGRGPRDNNGDGDGDGNGNGNGEGDGDGDGDDIFNIYNYDYLENEFGAPPTASNRLSDSDEFVGIEKQLDGAGSSKFNFVEACESLKEDIYAIQPAPPTDQDEVTLEDCKSKLPENLCLSDDGSHSSLSRSDESSSDYELGNCKINIMHLAEVHEANKSDRKLKASRRDRSAESPRADDELAPVEEIDKRADGDAIDPISDRSSDTERGKYDELANIVETSMLKSNSEIDGKELLSDNSSLGSKSDNLDEPDILLASAAIDGTCWVWNTNIGTSCDSLKSHPSPNYQSGKNNNVEVLWYHKRDLIVNDKHGELTYWALNPATNVCPQHVRRYKFHETKKYFNFQRHVRMVSIDLCEQSRTLWCITTAREIICENLVSKQIIGKFCCASTNISVMCENLHNLNRIALGFSDRRVGILDMTKMSPTNVHIDNYSQRIDAQVTALAWSPDCKRLAFGTYEGRIGIIMADVARSIPFVYNSMSGKPIYALDWQQNCIYGLCNQQVAVFNDSTKCKDGQYIAGIRDVSTLSVRGNYLFVGTQNGHLKLYQQRTNTNTSTTNNKDIGEYEMLEDLELNYRYVCCLSWHPKVNGSLAVVTHSHFVYIIKFDETHKTMNLQRRLEIQDTKTTTNWVKWSNNDPNILLTCSYDGAVRIWDLSNAEKPLKFIKQFPCPMNCGLLLPTDENFVICAGKYTSLECFDMRTNPSNAVGCGMTMKSMGAAQYFGVNNIAWAVSVLPRVTTKVQPTAEKRRNRRAALQRSQNEEHFEESGAQVPEALSEQLSGMQLVEKKPSNLKSPLLHENVHMRDCATILYLTAKELNIGAQAKLTYILNSPNFKLCTEKLLCSKLLGSQREAKELLTEELRSYRESDVRGIPTLMAPLIHGNIKEEITKCTQNKKLNEWHVALAPTVSYGFWQNCCEAFADQLLEQGHALQAATYLMAIHKQTEAIKLLLGLNYHKEAMLIARVYLQPDDPLIGEVLDSWIKYLDVTGNLVGAALISTLAGQTKRACEILERVRNPQSEIENAIKILSTGSVST